MSKNVAFFVGATWNFDFAHHRSGLVGAQME
jgi:hypothetical protein